MARSKRSRRVADLPVYSVFKATGVPSRLLSEEVMSIDEFEAIRLADYEGLYQEQAAQRMGVSRATFGRILEAARKKVARTLLEGCVLRIEGGQVTMPLVRSFFCKVCSHSWNVHSDAERPGGCPACRSRLFQRVDKILDDTGPPTC